MAPARESVRGSWLAATNGFGPFIGANHVAHGLGAGSQECAPQPREAPPDGGEPSVRVACPRVVSLQKSVGGIGLSTSLTGNLTNAEGLAGAPFSERR